MTTKEDVGRAREFEDVARVTIASILAEIGKLKQSCEKNLVGSAARKFQQELDVKIDELEKVVEIRELAEQYYLMLKDDLKENR